MGTRYDIVAIEPEPSPPEFEVWENGERVASVWWDEGVAYCCNCSGPLTAMSRSCPHAKAVKRRMAVE